MQPTSRTANAPNMWAFCHWLPVLLALQHTFQYALLDSFPSPQLPPSLGVPRLDSAVLVRLGRLAF